MLKFNIHHVSINVSDVTKSKNFYQLFDFEECHCYTSINNDLQIIHLLGGNCILELFYYSNSPKNKTISSEIKHSEFIGIDHFSLQTDNIEKAFEKLNKYIKGNLEIQIGRTGIRYFFVTDPDGNLIEIVEDNRELKITNKP